MMRKALVFAFAAGAGATTSWNYRDVDAWPAYVAEDGAANVCGTGTFQSPIDIVKDAGVVDEKMGALDFSVAGGAEHQTEIEVNAHTWEVVWGAGAEPAAEAVPEAEATERRLHFGSVGGGDGETGITFDGTEYGLKQFHYHSPSENTVDGKYYDMEAHHVHKAADGKYLVIAVFLKVGKENEYLKGFWGDLEGVSAVTKPVKGMKLSSPYENFLPHDKSYWKYDGSFTTPPCTEGTTWVVMSNHVELSAAQLAAYRAGINDVVNNQLASIHKIVPDASVLPGVSAGYSDGMGVNNRPVQQLNGRTVSWYYDPTPKQEAEEREAKEEKDLTPLWVTLSCVAGLVIIGLLTMLVLHYLKEPPKKKRAVKQVPRPQDVVMMVPQPVQTASYPVTTYAAPQQYAAPSPYVIR